NGGKIKQNYFVGWWNGQHGTAKNAGVIKYQDNGAFRADFSSTANLDLEAADIVTGTSLSDSLTASYMTRSYEIYFKGMAPKDNAFPPLNSKSVAISADDRFLAIETQGSPNKIYLYDFAGNNFGHETQLEGWVTDYRVGNATYWAFGNPAANCFLSNSNPTTANGIKLMDAITSRDTWTGYKNYPANFYLAATDTVSGGNNTDKRDSNRRHFGYFRPGYDAMQVAVANQDHSRLFVNHSFAGSRADASSISSEGSFVYKVSQASYTTSLFQIDYNTNAGNVKQGIFTHTDPTQSVGAISSSGSGDSKYMTMGSSWTAIASNSTIPFRFQPTFLTIYELTNCNNDSASAMVWSRDVADPILYFLDTIQDDVWVIKPGKPATRIDYAATSIDFTDNQLVVSNDGQVLAAAREDNKTVMLFDISEPASFNFPGGTVSESSLTSNFGKIDFIATMSAIPTTLAAAPYNIFKSSTTKGTYQWVATLTLPISGNSNAALASGGIYIMGGSPELNSAPTDKIFFFDPTKVYTSNIPPLATTLSKAIKRHSTVAYDNEIYVFNGMDSGGNNLAWVQKYNPETKTVTSSFDPPAVTYTQLQVNATMTSINTPNPVSVSDSGDLYDSDVPGWEAFDGLTTSNEAWATNSNNQYVIYDPGNSSLAFVVNKIYVYNAVADTNGGVNGYTLSGWDGSTWLPVWSHNVPINSTNYLYSYANSTAFQKYKFQVTSRHGSASYYGLREIRFFLENIRKIPSVAMTTGGPAPFTWHQSGENSGNSAYKAFDNNTGTWWEASSSSNSWIGIYSGVSGGERIKYVRITCSSSSGRLNNFWVEGANDSTFASAVQIPFSNSATNAAHQNNVQSYLYTLNNSSNYRYYRLWCQSTHDGNNTRINEVEFYTDTTSVMSPTEPVMTKTMTDMRGETQTTDGAACTTPYGIVVGGGATSTVLVYWPHGKDNYNGPNDQSIGICRSLPKFPLENGAAGTDDRAYHSLVWHKGKLYRVGGRRGGTTLLNSIDIFDFNTNSWTNIMLDNMTQFPANGSMLQRDNAAACSFGDEIFMFGGSIGASVGATPLNNAVAWNPETKTVRSLGTMAIAKNFAKTAVPCGSAIYLIGGATDHSTGGDANIWKFTP
ncbi:MAG TPA: kelch repeat-containing protein, partial [Candidatus Rifleibacterium sp.]|nr:kelch repeat-containing protein [Candidatus Rifleibacterium sp.]